eukprot:comp21745_c0_seq1/m.30795 comp21745_c0_seq1/g.30795  ORF comp21745_c0_seq1/g.30795 comp21745_c0_seq1/m.30795 type:complete len:388 (-) comp21745_c0_seq1:640-1803(-)
MKKTMNIMSKTAQWTGEKLGRVEATRMDDDFLDLERRSDCLDVFVKSLSKTTEDYLIADTSSKSKLRSGLRYPEPEESVAEVLKKGAAGLPDSVLGDMCLTLADGEMRVADVRSQMDTDVYNNLIRPMNEFHNRDAKETESARKKLESRRLEYDTKRNAWSKKPGDVKLEDDFRLAEARFEEAKENAVLSMTSLLNSEPEHCRALITLANAQLQFYRDAAAIMEPIIKQLESQMAQSPQSVDPAPAPLPRRTSVGVNTPPRAPTPSGRTTPVSSMSMDSAPVAAPRRVSGNPMPTSASSSIASLPRSASRGVVPVPVQRPASPPAGFRDDGKVYVTAMYDFQAEQSNELDFKKGERIEFLAQLDENWMQGKINGRTGIFPCNFVSKP